MINLKELKDKTGYDSFLKFWRNCQHSDWAALNPDLTTYHYDQDKTIDLDLSAEELNNVMSLVIDLRKKVKDNKDYATSDEIRNRLQDSGIQIKDGKEGATWTIS